MTNAEYKDFLTKLERCFPSFGEWLRQPPQNWTAMLQDYYEGLKDENVTPNEANQVLKGWHNGRIEGAPVGFENQRFLANLLNAVRQLRAERRLRESRTTLSQDILGECEDLPIRCKVANKGPLVGCMVAEFQRLVEANRSKGVATA